MQTGLGLTNKANYHILTPEKLDMFRRAFNDLQVIIIDEVSMCGADKIYDIHKRICEIIISEELFGNIAIIFVGDLMQVRTISFNFNCCNLPNPFKSILATTSEGQKSVFHAKVASKQSTLQQ